MFPSAGRLSSTDSAAATAALFAGFAGTTRPSDFPRSFIPGLPPQRSLGGPPSDRLDGRAGDLPVLAHEDSVHAQVLRPRGVHRTARANAAGSVAFRLVRRRRHPETVISRLNSWPAVPLSTLRCALAGRQRMTRGHRGSLLLRCPAFSSLSSCRFIPALSPRSMQKPQTELTSPTCRTPPRQSAVPARLIPRAPAAARRCHLVRRPGFRSSCAHAPQPLLPQWTRHVTEKLNHHVDGGDG